MTENNSLLLKTIIKAINENNLDSAILDAFKNSDTDKGKLARTISSLCGVDVPYSDDFIANLKTELLQYNENHKVISKISPCPGNCSKGIEGCIKSCPFDAIIMNKEKNGVEINSEKCTDCGLCVESCEKSSFMDKTEFIPLMNIMKSGTPVIAAVAPAISGQFGENVTIDMLRTAFIKLGFLDMVEVAFFADILTLKETIEFNRLVKEEKDFMITSCCCPMWVGMLKKVYENLVPHVSPSVSPMIAAGRILKLLNPNCKVVFIGPCIAKKAEAKEKDLAGAIDFVLTFAELKEIFEASGIYPQKLEETPSTEYASRGGKLYARAGGVSIAVEESLGKIFPDKHKLFKAVSADGIKDCKTILEKAKTGDIDANFIEGMGCSGGCVGGPKVLIDKEAGKKYVDRYAEQSNIKVSVESPCLKDILNKIEINSHEDLNDKNKMKIFIRQF